MPDRHHGIADRHLVRVGQRQRVQPAGAARVHAQDGEVGRPVGSEHLGVDEGTLVGEANLSGLRIAHHVSVGHDRAVVADHESRARCRSGLYAHHAGAGGVVHPPDLRGGEPPAREPPAVRWRPRADSIVEQEAAECHGERREGDHECRSGQQPAPARRLGRRLGPGSLPGRVREGLRLERLPAPARRGERSRVGVAPVLTIDPETGLAAHEGDATQRRVTGR